jgi:phage portal protein BeeE
MDIQPLSFSPHDAEFLDSRKFSVAEIAYMFDLDPADLGAVVGASSVVYQNLEQRAVDRQTNSYAKWIHRFEQAWTDLLPGRQAARFDTDNVLRTDTLARLQADEIGLRTGVYTLNDARRRERLPLYGPWADQPFAQPPTVEPDKEPVAALPPGEVT